MGQGFLYGSPADFRIPMAMNMLRKEVRGLIYLFDFNKDLMMWRAAEFPNLPHIESFMKMFAQ